MLILLSQGNQHDPSPFVLILLEQKREQNKMFVAELKKMLDDKT